MATKLVRKERIHHPEDVAAIQAVLRDRGYEASDEDVQWAFSLWCSCNLRYGWVAVGGGAELAADRALEHLVPPQDEGLNAN